MVYFPLAISSSHVNGVNMVIGGTALPLKYVFSRTASSSGSSTSAWPVANAAAPSSRERLNNLMVTDRRPRALPCNSIAVASDYAPASRRAEK